MSEHTNLDLQTAQALLIAAGEPKLAEALKYQSEGIYNLVQGAWGQSFVNSFELMVNRQTQAIAEAVSAAVRLEVAASLAPFQAQLTDIRNRLDRKREQLDDHEQRIAALEAQLRKARE